MNRKLTGYTLPTCGCFRQGKAFLVENGVEYEQIDFATDEDAVSEIVRRNSQQGLPVTDIDGTLVVGFDRGQLADLVQLT